MTDVLDTFIRFADQVQAAHADAQRPAYAETCACGASVEVGRSVDAKERRQIRLRFQGRHRQCLQQIDFNAPQIAILEDS